MSTAFPRYRLSRPDPSPPEGWAKDKFMGLEDRLEAAMERPEGSRITDLETGQRWTRDERRLVAGLAAKGERRVASPWAKRPWEAWTPKAKPLPASAPQAEPVAAPSLRDVAA